ncbi:MAG: hypothetical protein U0744_07000 [Gemmataceae bacterium]
MEQKLAAWLMEHCGADEIARQQIGSELMRWNLQERLFEIAFANVVLPTPGTSSISKCPSESSAMSHGG